MYENILGHQKEINILKNIVKSDKILNAYLFVGNKGIGKSLVAKEFAKDILNIQNLNSSNDYKYVSRLDGKKDITIDQIRTNIKDDVQVIPSSGDKKVYIIDDSEFLNVESQNALLKTLEEPPFYTVIILIASSVETILPTILSRLYVINFLPLSHEEVVEYIEKKYNTKFDDKVINFVDGSIGTIDNIIGNNLQPEFEKINNLYKLLEKKSSIEVINSIKDINFKVSDVLSYLEYLLYTNNKYNCVEFVEKAKQRLKNNGNYDIVINTMILKILDKI